MRRELERARAERAVRSTKMLLATRGSKKTTRSSGTAAWRARYSAAHDRSKLARAHALRVDRRDARAREAARGLLRPCSHGPDPCARIRPHVGGARAARGRLLGRS